MSYTGDYARIYAATCANGRARLPDAIEDLNYIAAMLETGVVARGMLDRRNTGFGKVAAIEAAHKLAQWIMADHRRAHALERHKSGYPGGRQTAD